MDIGQTTAICNAIGKKARMEGNTFREFAVSQMLLAHAEELYAGMQRFNPTVNVSLEKKKVTQEDYLAWWSKAIPGHFEKLEALLGQYMGRFTSSGTTVGELYLFSILHQIVLVAPQCIEKAGTTQLLGFYSGTKALPGVAKVLSGASPYGELAQYFIAHEAAPPAARAFSNPTATSTFTTTTDFASAPSTSVTTTDMKPAAESSLLERLLGPPSLLDALYGLCLAGGGAYGYLKTRSVPSLVMGLGSGAIVSFARGHLVKSVWSLVLAALMGKRWFTGARLMPSGAVSILAGAMCLVNAARAAKRPDGAAAALEYTGGNVIPDEDDVFGAGVVEQLGDMDVYRVGSGTRAIILIYDIMGVSAECRHNCDQLAAAGFLVVMPDLFRSDKLRHWSRTPGPAGRPAQRPEAADVDREILQTVVPYVQGLGGRELGIVGFCFGGSAAMRLAPTGVFLACGGCHAGGLKSPEGEALVAKARCPIMLLQAGGDPDLKPVFEAVKEMDDDIRDKSVLRTYWDQKHGWVGAHGDRKGDPRVRAAVECAMDTMIKVSVHRRLRDALRT